MTTRVTMDEVLGATFDTLSVERLKVIQEERQLFAVESHGVLLQPSTTKETAESVYAHCESYEKCLLEQRGDKRSIVETNAPWLLQRRK